MRLLGHPVHPMLVHFPIVFWSSTLVADVVGLITGAPLAADLAFCALALGCVSGLLAMVAGVVDFLDVPRESPARDTSVSHLVAMCSAWLIFLVALALHGYPPKTPVSLAALIASAAGFLTMAYGAWLGGRLVYQYRVGMV
jgi:uncharacterized membrane protein